MTACRTTASGQDQQCHHSSVTGLSLCCQEAVFVTACRTTASGHRPTALSRAVIMLSRGCLCDSMQDYCIRPQTDDNVTDCDGAVTRLSESCQEAVFVTACRTTASEREPMAHLLLLASRG